MNDPELEYYTLIDTNTVICAVCQERVKYFSPFTVVQGEIIHHECKDKTMENKTIAKPTNNKRTNRVILGIWHKMRLQCTIYSKAFLMIDPIDPPQPHLHRLSVISHCKVKVEELNGRS